MQLILVIYIYRILVWYLDVGCFSTKITSKLYFFRFFFTLSHYHHLNIYKN